MNKTQELIGSSYLTGMMTVVGIFSFTTGFEFLIESRYIFATLMISFGGWVEYKVYGHLRSYQKNYFKKTKSPSTNGGKE